MLKKGTRVEVKTFTMNGKAQQNVKGRITGGYEMPDHFFVHLDTCQTIKVSRKQLIEIEEEVG